MGLDMAAMHVDEAAHEREPDAEPALRTIELLRALHERVEDGGQHIAGDALAIVFDLGDRLLLAHAQAHRDRSTARRVLGRVREEVLEDLRETEFVAVDVREASWCSD